MVNGNVILNENCIAEIFYDFHVNVGWNLASKILKGKRPFKTFKKECSGLGMTRGRYPSTVLSPAQIKKKEAWVGNEKPAQKQSCVGWYRPCKIVNSSSRTHVNWFKEIHFKLILLTFFVMLSFLRKILTAATFCYLIYFQSLRNFFCRGKTSWCHEESVSLSLVTGLVCFNISQ